MFNFLKKRKNKDRREYFRTCKKYKKELKELVKSYGPWDNFLPCLFDIQVRHWIDYYTLNYNVWAVEVKDTPEFNKPDRPTRLEIAKELKRLYDEYDNFLLNVDLGALKEKYGSINKEASAEIEAEYRAKRKAFFDYYMEYAQDMWD